MPISIAHIAGALRRAGAIAALGSAALLATALVGCVEETAGVQEICLIPVVIGTSPASDETNVPLNKIALAPGLAKVSAVKVITATFNTRMDPATINASTFLLMQGSDTIAGSVSYSDSTAVFVAPSDLAPGLTYTAKITAGARDRIGTPMAADHVWNFSTIGAGTPTLFSPGNGATGQSVNPTLIWVTVPGAASYRVQVSLSPAFVSTVYDTVVTGTSQQVQPALASGATYYWRVSADISGETGPYSAVWRFTTQAPPAVPVLISPVAVAQNQSTSPTFTWNPAARASSYRLQVSTSPVFLTTVFDDSTISGTSRAITGLIRGTIYYWRVNAKNTAGTSAWATRSFTTTTSMLQPPELVSPSNGAVNRPANPVLNWNASTGADTYRVQVSTSPIFVTTVVNDSTVTGLSRQVSGLAPGTTYYWRVNAKDSAGTSAYSTVWNFTVAGGVVPSVNLGSAARFGGMGGSAGITNQGTLTQIHGSLITTAVSTLVTGFHDGTAAPGNTFTETPLNIGAVRDTIHTATAPQGSIPGAVATQALADAQAAYLYLAGLPPGADPAAGELGGLTLAPGTYTAASGSFAITLVDLTLDAQGDPDAQFVFQMASSLTVGSPGPQGARSVILLNGAQAKNVFWQVGTSATLNGAGGGTLAGTIIAQSGVTFSTSGNARITRLDGRALSLVSSVTMVNTIITVPQP